MSEDKTNSASNCILKFGIKTNKSIGFDELGKILYLLNIERIIKRVAKTIDGIDRSKNKQLNSLP